MKLSHKYLPSTVDPCSYSYHHRGGVYEIHLEKSYWSFAGDEIPYYYYCCGGDVDTDGGDYCDGGVYQEWDDLSFEGRAPQPSSLKQRNIHNKMRELNLPIGTGQ